VEAGVVRRLQLISRARVPLLMFIDTEVGIACDVSIDNGNALYKSRVLRWVTDLDPRCRQLIFLVRFQCIVYLGLFGHTHLNAFINIFWPSSSTSTVTDVSIWRDVLPLSALQFFCK
jgi:hypothetical protein